MKNIAPSPLAEINAILEEHNPFVQPPVVLAPHVWEMRFPDISFFNAHASDAVFQALEDVHAGKYLSTSLLITAQNGTGKTHIISRIRHKLQAQGGALFVFASKFDDLNQVKAGFQQILADSLSNLGSHGVTQWQELATAMVNNALQFIDSNAKLFTPKELVKKIEKTVSEEQVSKWINQLTKAFCRIKTVKDPDIVRAIFWTLSADEKAYASNWLAGKSLAQFKANDLRLPEQKQSFDAVLEILGIISQYNKLLICFDELDVSEFDDHGFHKSQIITNFVKELFENLRRGVILSVMMPGTWNDRVKKELPGGVIDKMTAQGKPYELKHLDSNSTVQLVECLLDDFYKSKNVVPPYPVYPFVVDQLQAIGREKPTVREVLKWCRDNCKVPQQLSSEEKAAVVPTIAGEPELDLVELAFFSELNDDIRSSLDNNHFLAEALLFGFESIVGDTVEKVTVEAVTDRVGKKNKKDTYLNFKITGRENGDQVNIGVAVLQQDGGRALGAGLRRLLDENGDFNLTRGCLVRSKSKPVNSYFQNNYINPLVNHGGEFVDLKEDEIKPLIAMLSVYRKRDSDYKVTEQQISDFIKTKGFKHCLGIHNPLLKEILSEPSYQVPSDLIDEPKSFENLGDSGDEDPEELKGLAHV